MQSAWLATCLVWAMLPPSQRGDDNIVFEDTADSDGSVVTRTGSGGGLTKCACRPLASCPPTSQGHTDGTHLIDVRIVSNCVFGQFSTSKQCPPGSAFCCVDEQQACGCGTRKPQCLPGVRLEPGQACFAKYPWVGMVLDDSNKYVGGAVLVGPKHLLTAAHKVAPYVSRFDIRNLCQHVRLKFWDLSVSCPNWLSIFNPGRFWATSKRLKVRLGEWNTRSTAEPYPFVEVNVVGLVIHPHFNPTDLNNDIAVITLKDPVPAGQFPHISAACLPEPRRDFTNQRCWVAGWGKNAFGPQGSYQNTQRETAVPILSGAACEQQLRSTRLGQSYKLDRTSFLCAGGEPGQDACTGDGGSPLVCESGGLFTLAGLVSWGIGCAERGIPGVYVNVPSYKEWVSKQIHV